MSRTHEDNATQLQFHHTHHLIFHTLFEDSQFQDGLHITIPLNIINFLFDQLTK